PVTGFLRKYDLQGAEMWTRLLGEGTSFLPLAATDATGVYVGFRPPNQPNSSVTSIVRRYNAAGNELWSRELPGIISALAANASGLYETSCCDPKNGYRSRFRRFDSAGNQIWDRDVAAGTIAPDANSVYVTSDSVVPGQCASGFGDVVVQRYDTDGKVVWTRQFGTYRIDGALGVILDSTSVVVIGNTIGLSDVPGSNPAFLAKLEKNSAPIPPSETRIRNECVLNAASYVGGAVAPGEMVTILGQVIGPAQPVSAKIVEDRPLDTTLAETRVLFNGIPAPLLYASSSQTT